MNANWSLMLSERIRFNRDGKDIWDWKMGFHRKDIEHDAWLSLPTILMNGESFPVRDLPSQWQFCMKRTIFSMCKCVFKSNPIVGESFYRINGFRSRNVKDGGHLLLAYAIRWRAANWTFIIRLKWIELWRLVLFLSWINLIFHCSKHFQWCQSAVSLSTE